jgi:glycogen(starch) synthase
MKILMFGWEFPPHISGGLGTACLGLSTSLIKQGVEILFVVPKLYGDEYDSGLTFINASDVKLNTQKTEDGIKGAESPSLKGKSQFESKLLNTDYTRGYRKTSSRHNSRLSIVEVPSGLRPYRSPEFQKESKAIEHWNYSAGYHTERERHFALKLEGELPEETANAKKEQINVHIPFRALTGTT